MLVVGFNLQEKGEWKHNIRPIAGYNDISMKTDKSCEEAILFSILVQCTELKFFLSSPAQQIKGINIVCAMPLPCSCHGDVIISFRSNCFVK